MPDPYRFFRIEAVELTDALEAGLLELERGGASPEQALARVLRHAHTLKGAARVVRHETSASLAHAMEDLLVPVREASAPLSPDLISQALVIVDSLRRGLLELDQPAPPAAPSAASTPAKPANVEPPPDAATRQRAEPPAKREQVGRLLEHTAALGAKLAELNTTRARLTRARRRGASSSASEQRAGVLVGSMLAAAIQRSAEPWLDDIALAERELTSLIDVTTQGLRELREGLERLRLLDTEDLRAPLERTARDTALAVGKRVRFEFHGGGLRIEPELHAAAGRALLQAVKNSVVHGIEEPEVRLGRGKPVEGRVSVTIEGQGANITFSCDDDGRGLDLEALRTLLATRDVPDAHAQSERALIETLLSGGVSTAPRVTAVAGRGIGLDLMRDAAQGIGATLRLQNRPGHGVKFGFVTKADLAAFPALLLEAEGTAFALPIHALWQTTRYVVDGSLGPNAGLVVDGQLAVFWPLVSLIDPSIKPMARPVWTVILLRNEEGLLALGVDRLLGTESVVTQPMPDAAPPNPALAGLSTAVDGSTRFLLDTGWLQSAAQRQEGGLVSSSAPPPPILVIDDSLTTRMLERSILESAGYEVEMATSAEEGLLMARAKKYALFLVDVEMPGMDGFTFIETTQADPELSATPAILVTSRNSPEDLARGARVGAQGHVVKSEFDQVDLLDRIEKLVRRS